MAIELFRTVKLYYGTHNHEQHVWYDKKGRFGNSDHNHFLMTIDSKYTKEESWWLAIGLYAKNRIKEYQNV